MHSSLRSCSHRVRQQSETTAWCHSSEWRHSSQSETTEWDDRVRRQSEATEWDNNVTPQFTVRRQCSRLAEKTQIYLLIEQSLDHVVGHLMTQEKIKYSTCWFLLIDWLIDFSSSSAAQTHLIQTSLISFSLTLVCQHQSRVFCLWRKLLMLLPVFQVSNSNNNNWIKMMNVWVFSLSPDLQLFQSVHQLTAVVL